MHGHGDHAHHDHAHEAPRALRLAFLLNLSFTVVEFIGGWWVHSMAVLTDAVHDLGDCVILGAAWYLQRLSVKGRDARYSYGYGRFSVLGGWAGAFVLLAGAAWMLTETIPRFWAPVLPETKGMMALAVFGVIMNGMAAWQLHGRSSLNERTAFFHLLEDVLGWAAVLVGGVVIAYTGWSIIDPLLSVLICLFIIRQALRMLQRGTGLIMQATPAHLDLSKVSLELAAIDHVSAVRDAHAWSLDGELIVATVHLRMHLLNEALSAQVRTDARAVLSAHGIRHVTIELEALNEPDTNTCAPP